MEKPKDEGDAFDMLQRLSGKWHKVHTGVAVYATGTSERTKDKLMFSFTDTVSGHRRDRAAVFGRRWLT